MPEEIPEEIPPMSDMEEQAAAKLSKEDIQTIDDVLMAECASGWLKTTRIVSHAEDKLRERFPRLSFIFYTERLIQLVEDGRLKSQGYLRYIRFSEVKLPIKE